jgi:8-oxo-dGTP diphosphatase
MDNSDIDRRIAVVALFDDHGRLLMQHRDDKAPVSPNKWCCPGGGIEPGETAEEAAHRELWEETGLRVNGSLTLLWQGLLPATGHLEMRNEYSLFTACTQARQEDVVLGEGQAMVFVPLAQVPALDLSPSATYFVKLLLASAEKF